jgi:hypothetical protein
MASKSIKLRAKEKGGVTTVKALMTHPMETGLRKDSKTGKLIPAHYIRETSTLMHKFYSDKASICAKSKARERRNSGPISSSRNAAIGDLGRFSGSETCALVY